MIRYTSTSWIIALLAGRFDPEFWLSPNQICFNCTINCELLITQIVYKLKPLLTF